MEKEKLISILREVLAVIGLVLACGVFILVWAAATPVYKVYPEEVGNQAELVGIPPQYLYWSGVTMYNSTGYYSKYYCGEVQVIKVEHLYETGNVSPYVVGSTPMTVVTTDHGVYEMPGFENPGNGVYELYSGYSLRTEGYRSGAMQLIERCPTDDIKYLEVYKSTLLEMIIK